MKAFDWINKVCDDANLKRISETHYPKCASIQAELYWSKLSPQMVEMLKYEKQTQFFFFSSRCCEQTKICIFFTLKIFIKLNCICFFLMTLFFAFTYPKLFFCHSCGLFGNFVYVLLFSERNQN